VTESERVRLTLNGLDEAAISILQRAEYDEIVFTGGWLPLDVLRVVDAGRVRSASLAACANLDDTALAVIAQWVQLEWLDLTCCSLVTDHGIEQLRSLRSLRELYVRWVYDLTDASMDVLSSLPSLRVLDLDGCEEISDAGIGALARSHSLEDLVVPDFSSVTDVGIRALATGVAPLRRLCISSFLPISADAIVSLASLRSLRSLRSWDRDGLAELQILRPDVEIGPFV
jgi:hypothetical protein